MNKEDAASIQRHALAAADAIKKIELLVLGLTKEERTRFAGYFADLSTALHFGVLQDIYDLFPELRVGHEEYPSVSSFLKWEDVSLPIGFSAADLDVLILAVLKPTWQKTAVVITKTKDQCSGRGVSIDFEVIGARILALAESQRIEGAGNPSMWRHSEVRLKQS
jgi:hypothetical protein